MGENWFFFNGINKYLFTIMKISIWIQWNVALSRNEKILSIPNKDLFIWKTFFMNWFIDSNKYVFDRVI